MALLKGTLLCADYGAFLLGCWQGDSHKSSLMDNPLLDQLPTLFETLATVPMVSEQVTVLSLIKGFPIVLE